MMRKKSLTTTCVLAVCTAMFAGASGTASAATPTGMDAAVAVAEDKVGAPVTEAQVPITVAPGVTVAPAEVDGKIATTLTSSVAEGTSVVGVIAKKKTSSTHRLGFKFVVPTGARLEEVGDGRVAIVAPNDEVTNPLLDGTRPSRGVSVAAELAIIEQPWALDADGKTLPTTYTVEGNTLVQSVNTSGARFPVVADPKVVSTGFDAANLTAVIYVQWSKAETRTVSTNVQNDGIAAIAGICAKIPNVVGATVCAAVALYKYSDLKNNAIAAASNKQCLKARIPVAGVLLQTQILSLDFYRKVC